MSTHPEPPAGRTRAARTRVIAPCAIALGVTMSASLLAPPTAATSRTSEPGSTVMVSRSSGGVAGDGDSEDAAVSADGGSVAFTTAATTLDPGNPDSAPDVLVHDLDTGITELISRGVGGTGNGGSSQPSVSGDGRLVAFTSHADNLVTGDENTKTDVFVRNRDNATTQRVSITTAGVEGDADAGNPAISASGRYVAFESEATNLAPLGNGKRQIYVHDRKTGTTELVSKATGTGEIGNNHSFAPSISGNGRYVAFASQATTFEAGLGTDRMHIYLHDRWEGTTELITRAPVGVSVGNANSFAPSISANGRLIAFETNATNLTDVASGSDVVVYDRFDDAFLLASPDTSGEPTNGGTTRPSLSADGTRVAFEATGNDLVADDGNETTDIFLRDLVAGTTQRVSVASDGAEVSDYSRYSSTSWDGATTAFHSAADDLETDPEDLNEKLDVFARILDEPTVCPTTFTDVAADHLFCQEIDWLASSGITGGFADDTFRPSRDLSRQSMAAFLYRAAGSPTFSPPATPSFSDVPTSHQFFLEIEWLAASGITGGFADGTFGPTAVVTRGAIAAFLHRAADEPAVSGFPVEFVDVDDHIFETAIEWLATVGVTTGFEDGTFRPGEILSRQAMAAFLQRYSRLGLAPS